MKIVVLLLFFFVYAFAELIHVSPGGQSPIGRAMMQARAGDTIVLADGKYHEDVVVRSGVVLYSPNLFGAHVIGDGRGPVVRLNDNSKISGIVISRGRNGIVTSGTGVSIENCFIHSNQGSGILAINRLPAIVNSIIANNLNSGIQGTSIGSTEGELSHLTIARNRRNGIEIDGEQTIILRDCIFYRNGEKAIRTRNPALLTPINLIVFPEQREFAAPDDLLGKPRFSDRYYRLRDNSVGKNRASNGKDIGFVR